MESRGGAGEKEAIPLLAAEQNLVITWKKKREFVYRWFSTRWLSRTEFCPGKLPDIFAQQRPMWKSNLFLWRKCHIPCWASAVNPMLSNPHPSPAEGIGPSTFNTDSPVDSGADLTYSVRDLRDLAVNAAIFLNYHSKETTYLLLALRTFWIAFICTYSV